MILYQSFGKIIWQEVGKEKAILNN